jgi:hypothetical protein
VRLVPKRATQAPAKSSLKTGAKKRSSPSPSRNAAAKSPARATHSPKLLSGGNPQIAKGEGDAPVQAYIAALPGWKREVGRRIDALIVSTVPNVRKAVKWNSPFYGLQDEGWFLSFHAMTKYIKVAFFRGTSLRPMPPVESKQEDVRYYHVFEGDSLDEPQFVAWVRQASLMEGWRL